MEDSTAGIAAAMMMIFIIAIPIAILLIVSMWKVYTKAGFEGWECIVPIYNLVILLRIVGKPWWWFFLLLIPIVNYVFIVWIMNMLSKSFGKDEGFTVGLVLLGAIFIPILGLGKAKYEGPYGDPQLFQDYKNRNQPGFDFENDKLA